MGQPLKKDQLVGLFGEKAAERLYKILSDCCRDTDPCCATEKYTVRVEFISCTVGSPKYNIYVTPNTDLEGFIQFSSFKKLGGSYTQSGTSEVYNGISKGVEYLASANLIVPENSDSEIVVLDSRGNWSKSLSFMSDNCP